MCSLGAAPDVLLSALVGVFELPDMGGMGSLECGAIGVRAAVVAGSDLLKQLVDFAIAIVALSVQLADSEFLRREIRSIRCFYFGRRFNSRFFTGRQSECDPRDN